MNIKSTLRTLRLKLGKQILDKKTPLANIAFPPKSILFLRHDGKIGDYIVSSFVFREIKKQSPNTKIGVVCSKKNAYLFEQNPYIDELYFVKTKDIRDYIRCGRELAKERYDVLIDPTVTLRNRDLLFLRTIQAKSYIGYQKENYQLFNFNIFAQEIHFSEVYKQALELVGFKQISITYDVPFTEKSKQNIQDFLIKNNLSNYVVVNFFGAGSARRFNDNSMKSLLDNLTSNTMNIVLLTFPEVTEKLKSVAKEYQNVFIYEETKTVFDTIELIRNAKCVISPDTSIVHIASGFSKSLIAFYSQDEENFNHWQPNNSASTHILRFNKSVNELDFSQIKPEWLYK
ncbi:glycosyltransferase family 9 protein [Haemophilus parahaemolyticus]|uniref:glycosyltransferase family 9 protein n=1 Tax=Haemophilus parahaemolyticus TaxID=735 RepID=UPI0028D13A67|nr:glycosyltransferase family 9 protein [Haemophilus parahaemolyticus]